MKTAISIPDETFNEAERRAAQLGVSRSEFFTTAARHYIQELNAESLTGRIDAALAFAIAILAPGGAMVAKLFMGAEFKQVVDTFKRHFVNVDVTRTKASRPGSSELYIVARDFRG